jgi:hypothetical protein
MAQALMLWVVAASSVLAQDAAPTTSQDFTALHAELCKKEKWETVAWKTDLRDVQVASVQEKKPIFIWAMDGQTLGCT